MTITYNIDVPYFGLKGILSLLFRWRGSVWIGITIPLILWLIAFYTVQVIYRYALRPYDQNVFDRIIDILKERTDSVLPMTFILGFFVTAVIKRWQKCLNNIGWIDSPAMSVATNIPGHDEEIRIIRRTIIRYLVLCQTLVFRNISVQVKRRFPTLETIEVAKLMTAKERKIIEEKHDEYSQFFLPLVWAGKIINHACEKKMISSDVVANGIANTIQGFQTDLRNLLKLDWVPIPLVYPQLVAFCVRFYFFLCLFTRQIMSAKDSNIPDSFIFWIPLPTLVEFVIYIGWLDVAEKLLHPLGEGADDLECNYIIDKNLETGFTIVDGGGDPYPELEKDAFWDKTNIALLYSYETAKREVQPMSGSIANTNIVKNTNEIIMVPHMSKLSEFDTLKEKVFLKRVDVTKFNKDFEMNEKKKVIFNAKKRISQLKKHLNDDNVELMSVITPTTNDK